MPSELVRIGGLARMNGAADLPFRASSRRLFFDGPFVPAIAEPSAGNTQTVGTPVGEAVANALVALVADTAFDVELMGAVPLPIDERALLAQVSALLEGALRGLEDPLTSVFQGLGIHLGGADVTVMSLSADQPQLAL